MEESLPRMRSSDQWHTQETRRMWKRRQTGPGRPVGELHRLTPISRSFGFDRGQPIDRYYIERFFPASNRYPRPCIGNRVTLVHAKVGVHR